VCAQEPGQFAESEGRHQAVQVEERSGLREESDETFSDLVQDHRDDHDHDREHALGCVDQTAPGLAHVVGQVADGRAAERPQEDPAEAERGHQDLEAEHGEAADREADTEESLGADFHGPPSFHGSVVEVRILIMKYHILLCKSSVR